MADLGDVLDKIKALVAAGEFRASQHSIQELANDDIDLREVVAGTPAAVQIEEYPAFGKGPCVLVFHRDAQNRPLHIVWGISKGQTGPAILVTAYRPDPERWSADFMRRREP